jgi:alpha-mannosidase
MKTLKTFVFLLLTFSLLFVTCKPNNIDVAETTEQTIRESLKIPDSAKHVLILSHAAHMDWDWLNMFPYNVDQSGQAYNLYYFGGNTQPADSILSKATQNLQNSAYYYSVCEMGFLRAFAKNKPSLFSQMKASGRMRVVGGGITSPDNLLPNGEAFFRNYLVANTWLDEAQVPWSTQVWIPDDFGHDPQLPVMLNAMDAMGVGFARIPGACDGCPQNGFNKPASDLLNTTDGGVDFIWQSADGSEVIAHWLEDHYDQGNNIDVTGSDFASPAAIIACKDNDVTCNNSSNQVYSSTNVGHITSYLGANQPVSPTPYIYVHVSSDFLLPYQDLVQDAIDWNASPDGYAKTGVYAVVATFDEYIRLVDNHKDKLKTRTYNAASAATDFAPNPYWMGYYASRPELKILHNKATKSLLSAESFQVLENTLLGTNTTEKKTQSAAIYNAWNTLAASTHHDYITGTAVDEVYMNEQLPMLNQALTQGTGLSQNFMQNITNNIKQTSGAVAVFNQLGMSNQGIVAYDSGGKTSYLNVQAPSLGYQLNTIATASQGDGSLNAAINPNGDYYFQNNFLTATFDQKTGEISSVIDKTTGNNILSANANEIVFYKDSGDIYRFGYETGCGFSKDTSASYTIQSITADTTNALNKSITITKQYTVNTTTFLYTITYSLRQGEPFLRISTTGTAPNYYTVMVKFPLAAKVNAMDVGTPYHWNTVYPMEYGSNTDFNETMWATHDFVVPKDANGTTLGAIYHSATPAWTSDNNALYGVILRNTPGNCSHGYGANGSDRDEHTQEYALRIPSGLTSAKTGNPLKEARQYNTPMVAMAATGSGNLPTQYSLASPTGNTNTLITAAKWSSVNADDFILRTYQASNTTTTETINLAKSPSGCEIVTALEKPFVNSNPNSECAISTSTVKVTMEKAVTTLKINYQ